MIIWMKMIIPEGRQGKAGPRPLMRKCWRKNAGRNADIGKETRWPKNGE